MEVACGLADWQPGLCSAIIALAARFNFLLGSVASRATDMLSGYVSELVAKHTIKRLICQRRTIGGAGAAIAESRFKSESYRSDCCSTPSILFTQINGYPH
jgi:hypothetical protein